MRITFILPTIGLCGGVRCTFELANRLQDRGHDVSIVYPLVPMRAGAKWYHLKKSAYRALTTVRNLKRAEQPNWFDLKANLIRVPTLTERWIPKGDVIVATLWATAYYVNSYKRDKGEKFHFVRGYETWSGAVDSVNKSYSLPLRKIVSSSWLKDLIERKFSCSVLEPLPDGVNFDLFYKERDGFECHSPKRLGILYRQLELKGMQDGLEAFVMAKKKYPNIQLVLFGEEPLRKHMEIVKNIDDIEFNRLLYKEKLRQLYNSLDIFIFPSHHEGFGDPPMEAMACGTAVVTTNVGAVSDYTVPGKTALVSPPKDPKALGQNIIRLLQDEKERRRIAESGYNYIKQFTWDKTTDNLEKIFMKTSKRQ
ncbi:MAG: glycosyltransferase family 4 protein [Desulfobacterales bacterium]|nr:glycosyltransferase family 4 protein [Desulfobacterales bacterium]